MSKSFLSVNKTKKKRNETWINIMKKKKKKLKFDCKNIRGSGAGVFIHQLIVAGENDD